MTATITASRNGLTPFQKREVRRYLTLLKITDLHHGDCVGGDADADLIATELGITIHVHPPSDPKLRAYLIESPRVVYPPEEYLVRNRRMVNATDFTIGCPKTNVRPRSLRGEGTWSTILYSLQRRPTIIIPTIFGTFVGGFVGNGEI